jgi:hypothetical protein
MKYDRQANDFRLQRKIFSLRTLSKLLGFAILTLPGMAWSVGETCNALLNLGLYNVSQTSSSTDAQSLSKSTFCSADYSRTDISSSTKASIKASYALFSGSGSVTVNDSEIIQKQSSVCTAGFNSSAYSNSTTAYSRTVYQGALDAWNKCQELANRGLVFEVLPSSTMQGVTTVITTPTGFTTKFLGVTQFGVGRSSCTTTVNGTLVNVGPSTPINMTAASKVTVNCARQMTQIGTDLVADAQDLVFVTSADTLMVPLASVGSLARETSDQVKADALVQAKRAINLALVAPKASISTLTTNVDDLKNKDSIFSRKINTLYAANKFILAKTCPAGWADYGHVGIIKNLFENLANPFDLGSKIYPDWWWVHPRLCGR